MYRSFYSPPQEKFKTIKLSHEYELKEEEIAEMMTQPRQTSTYNSIIESKTGKDVRSRNDFVENMITSEEMNAPPHREKQTIISGTTQIT